MDKTMLSCGCVIDWAKAEADERGCKFKSPTTGQECEFPETHGPDSDTCPLCHPKPSPSQAGCEHEREHALKPKDLSWRCPECCRWTKEQTCSYCHREWNANFGCTAHQSSMHIWGVVGFKDGKELRRCDYCGMKKP